MLGMACVLYLEGRPIINKREINIKKKKQQSAAWQSSVIFEGLMECSCQRENRKEKAINEGRTNIIMAERVDTTIRQGNLHEYHY